MSIGAMMRSAFTGGSFKEGYRELEVLEERKIPFGRDTVTIPFDFMATTDAMLTQSTASCQRDGRPSESTATTLSSVTT